MSDFSIPVRVYIEDTDAGGIVYYVNYLKFFERARTEYFRMLGYDKPAFVGEDKMFVVSEVNAKYHRAARLDDLLTVTTNVIEKKRVSLLFKQDIFFGGCLLASASIRIACVDKHSMKPVVIPAEILSAIH